MWKVHKAPERELTNWLGGWSIWFMPFLFLRESGLQSATPARLPSTTKGEKPPRPFKVGSCARGFNYTLMCVARTCWYSARVVSGGFKSRAVCWRLAAHGTVDPTPTSKGAGRANRIAWLLRKYSGSKSTATRLRSLWKASALKITRPTNILACSFGQSLWINNGQYGSWEVFNQKYVHVLIIVNKLPTIKYFLLISHPMFKYFKCMMLHAGFKH